MTNPSPNPSANPNTNPSPSPNPNPNPSPNPNPNSIGLAYPCTLEGVRHERGAGGCLEVWLWSG